MWGPRPYLLKRSEKAAAGEFSGYRATAPATQREPALGESWGLAPVLLEGRTACWTARGCSHWGASLPLSPAAAHTRMWPPRPSPAHGGVVLPGLVETGVPDGLHGPALPGHPAWLAAPSLEPPASVLLLDSRPSLPAQPPAQAPSRASVSFRGLALCSPHHSLTHQQAPLAPALQHWGRLSLFTCLRPQAQPREPSCAPTCLCSLTWTQLHATLTPQASFC